jgi:hypothetical protein
VLVRLDDVEIHVTSELEVRLKMEEGFTLDAS